VGKAAGIAIAGDRFDKDRGFRGDSGRFLFDSLQVLAIEIGIGFGVALAVEHLA
jgi:hypothetical protein